jgi:hypothetical protein
MYEAFFKGVLEVGQTCIGFLAHPGVTEEMLVQTGAVLIQVCGLINASYTCTGYEIIDNGIQIDRDVEKLIEGTHNVQGFRIRANSSEDTCELHFELMR